VKIAFDPVLQRPACVLVAAAFGADTALCHRFPLDSWLLAPTPTMGAFHVTEDQMAYLVRLVELQYQNKSR
jgi:hypothetical protein